MLAVRSVQRVAGDSVTIQLPAGFDGKQVEVIVLRVEEDEQAPGQLVDLLLTSPTLSEADLQGFEQVRDWLNQWTVSEF